MAFESGARFLDLLFERLENADVQYCIERNYKGYPNTITGDVDIVVQKADLEAAVATTRLVAKSLNWSPFVVYVSSQSAHIGFYADKYPSRFVLVIEFFTGGTWRGLKFLPAQRVICMRQKYGEYWKPNPSHEAIITLIHHLLYNRRVFPKYRNQIRDLVNEDPKLFQRELEFSVGLQLAKTVTDLVRNEKWDDLERKSMAIRWIFIVRSIALRPWVSAREIYNLMHQRNDKPEGVIISVEFGHENRAECMAEKLIEIANRWHVFVPPNRRKIFLASDDALAKVRMVVSSGGVAVVINPLGIEIGLPTHFKIVQIQEKEGKLFINFGGGESGQYIGRDADPNAIWNVILRDRSRALTVLE